MGTRANDPKLAVATNEARLSRVMVQRPPTRHKTARLQESVTKAVILAAVKEVITATVYPTVDPVDM